MRALVLLTICVASCALNACIPTPARRDITIHPLSEVTCPSFCLYHGVKKPIAIKWLRVSAPGDTRSDRKTVWELAYAPESVPEPKPGAPTLSDLVQPPEPDVIPVKPFSCITYGRAPPGYKEQTPAAPLIPDTWYSVGADHRAERTYPAVLSFIIRSDSSGRSSTLEYKHYGGSFTRVGVITNLNTTEVTK